ncbi:hypothetical protein ACVJGD_007947 [Bradyrhizobium sp. USDA 10063]
MWPSERTSPCRSANCSLLQAEHRARGSLELWRERSVLQSDAQGAPFQVCLSAEDSRPGRLADSGPSAPESCFIFGMGKLVLWNLSSTVKLVNGAATFATMSIYDPAVAPCGAAAAQPIKALGAPYAAEPKLVAASLHHSVAGAPSPSLFRGSWSDQFSTRCLSWCCRSAAPSFPRWLAVGMVMSGLAVILTATLIDKFSGRRNP